MDPQPDEERGRHRPRITRPHRPHTPADPDAGRAAQPPVQGPVQRPPANGVRPAIPAPPAALPPHRRPAAMPMVVLRELHRGGKPGDSYVRVMTAQAHGFRRVAPGVLKATDEAVAPRGRLARWYRALRRLLIGAPLATAQLAHERLTKVKALAVLSSDALSSSAYATEEILRALLLAGFAVLTDALPIALAIAALLVIVAVSYRQTIRAYPQGGGSYIVSRDNLGTTPGLIAAASLMIDYVLTVAVSIAAGVAAITSVAPSLHAVGVEMAVAAVVLITLANLRGVRESGTIFAAPTYLFILAFGTMIVVGLARILTGDAPGTLLHAALPQATAESVPPGTHTVGLFLILRAFSSGATALTGVEAISDGVPAFQPPEWKNARLTLTWMAIILTFLFLGITFLASRYGVVPSEVETVPSQIGRAVFGDGHPFYYVIQAGTAMILILAANTAFSDFPRLGYFLARDKFLPHQFMFRGDRLAFSNGIMVLGGLAALLLIVFRAETHRLIPLYAVGVFTSFTLSQSGMVRRWWRLREPGWRASMPVNAVGAVATAVVAVIVAATKFTHGAWMVIVLIGLLVVMFRRIHGHYANVEAEMELPDLAEPLPVTARPQTVIVPAADLNRAVVHALAYARSISADVTAVHVTDDLEAAERFRQKWESWSGGVPLVIVESPMRSFTTPLLAYIDAVDERDPEARVTVVLPEYVPKHWYQGLLHNQSALRLKAALLFRPNTVVIDVPQHLTR